MQEYEIKITYEGHICIEAESEEEAFNMAKEIWQEETTYDVAKWSEYALEQGATV